MDSGPPTIDYRSPSQDDPGSPPRRPALLWISASLVWFGSSILLIPSLVLFGEPWPFSAATALICVLLPTLALAAIEYGAIIRQRESALFIAVVFSLPAIGIPDLGLGIAHLLGAAKFHSDFETWPDVLGFTALTCITGMIAVVHYRWWSRLRRSGWREPMDA